jgi:hypothetical protein
LPCMSSNDEIEFDLKVLKYRLFSFLSPQDVGL